MREMTFFIGEGETAAAVIVSKLPESTYTNNPLNNVNRWRGQVGLPPLQELGDQKMEAVTIGDEGGTLLDLVGTNHRRLILAMLRRHGAIWYFKVQGHATTVGAERQSLESFLKSVKFGVARTQPDPHVAGRSVGGSAMPTGHPPMGSGQAGDGLPEGHAPIGAGTPAASNRTTALAEYKAPAAWKLDPERRPMREQTYHVGDPAKNTLVIVSRLPAETYTNNPLANINRWRDQVGLGPVEQLSDQPSRKLTIGGVEGSIYDLVGPRGGRQILALVTLGGDIWYFKIIGHTTVIDAEKENFESFLMSIRFKSP